MAEIACRGVSDDGALSVTWQRCSCYGGAGLSKQQYGGKFSALLPVLCEPAGGFFRVGESVRRVKALWGLLCSGCCG